eukprot:GFUD01044796.1.p1 GENE.GFUD01044796.1~~GFUD01044796.1.p1  ORF type:complete len:460 (+),score=177.71 GFUD01044796.1:184-1563(+)
MGNLLSHFFPKPAPASIEQVVEVSEDVAKTMEAAQDLNEAVAADVGLIDDSNPEDLVINESSIEAQEATSEALKASEIVVENTMAEVETIGSIPDIDVKVVDATIVAPLSNIETTPEPVISPNPEPEVEEVIATIELNKTQNDEEDMSGGVDGLRDVLQAVTPEPPKAPTPEPNPTPEPKDYTPEPVKSPTPEPPKSPTPEPTPIPESIKVSTSDPVKSPTPEPEVEDIGTIEENNAQNDKEDISGGVDGLVDVLQASTPDPIKAPTPEPNPEPVKSSTPTPEPTHIPESTPETVKTPTPEPEVEPAKSPSPEPPKAPTPEITPIPVSINVSTLEPVKAPTPEPEVEVIGTIEENKAQDEEENMSVDVDGLRDVLQAATSEPPKSPTSEPTPTPEAATSTPEPLMAPSDEPINLLTSENKNVPSPESIIATTTNDEEEISGGAAGLRDALQVSKDLNEE